MIARALILACLSSFVVQLRAAEPLKQKVDFLQLIKSGKVTYHVNDKQTIHDPPEKIWSFLPNGQLKVSGMGFGYVRSNDDFRDYHLVIEHKFTGPTHGTRTGKARDNGLFVHCHGPDGSYGGTWMSGIEAQIIEGGTGDILVLSSKMPDGSELTTSVTAEIGRDRDKEMIWKRGEARQAITRGRINWEKRDVDWKDEAGFRGRDDVESRLNEWTRMEVIAKGDTLQYFVNGVLVNECFECKPSEGKIFLQTEGAEMIVRRFELHPLGTFKEKWNPVSASGGSDISVRQARESAWTVAREQKSIEIDGPYEVQLVASEPLILDPVEMTWDAKGRCFVADMVDYPLGAGPGRPPLSRIVELLEPDAGGRYTKSRVVADRMDHVQGLLPYKDGLIATTRTQILIVRDTDGDGIADERKPLVEGFNPNHSQLQVSAPRWGLDNCVYFNNGLDTKEIYPAGSPDKRQTFARSNLRWDPASGKLEPTTGFGQFGGAFDDWGRHYFCSNRNPVMLAVLPQEAVIRNPHAGITQGWEDIAPSGAESKIHPLAITHTTADAHAGTHTAACGLGVYRGDLMPELRGEIFVCEPTAQAVIRYRAEPQGASLKAVRVGEHTEFFRSRDEWCRPVNVTTGPDGALYICDIYRQYIDHARFFPEEFSKTHDMRKGEHEGRIWRVVPRGTAGGEGKPVRRPIAPAPERVEDLVAWLGHKNAWQRETAQRLLVERNHPADFQAVLARMQQDPEPLAKVHGFGLLWHYGLRAVTEAARESAGGPKNLADAVYASLETLARHPQAAEPVLALAFRQYLEKRDFLVLHRDALTGIFARHGSGRTRMWAALDLGIAFPERRDAPPRNDGVAVNLLLRDIGDVWMQRAVLAVTQEHVGTVIRRLLAEKAFAAGYSPAKADWIRLASSASAANGSLSDVVTLLGALTLTPGELSWWKPAMLQGLAEGLPKSGGALGVRSLAELARKGFPNTTSLPPNFTAELGALLERVDKVMTDAAASNEQRLACIPLLAQRSWEKAEPVMRALLADGQAPEISSAALAALKRFPADKTAPLLYELLPRLGPAARLDVVKTLTGNGKTVKDFFERIDRGEIPKAFVDAETRWRYLRPSNPLYPLAEKIFGKPSADRAALISSYAEAAKMKGDPQKGHQIFATVCIACHRLKGQGVDVAPDITDVRIKEKDALLSDILDPNRMVEARWMAYQVDTKDGRTVSGIMAAETGSEVTLKMAGGVTESIPRSNIARMKCLDVSLMPVGLEATINKQQMGDLLAFLKGE